MSVDDNNNGESVEMSERELKIFNSLDDRSKAILDGKDPDEFGAGPDAEPSLPDQTGEIDSSLPSDNIPAGQDLGRAGDEQEAREDDWYKDPYVRRQAISYGLQEDELKGFGSLDEFERAGKLLDRQLKYLDQARADAGRHYGDNTHEAAPRRDQPETEPGTAKKTRLELLDLSRYENGGYDEDTLELVKNLRSTQEALDGVLRQNELREQQEREWAEQQENAQREAHIINSFHEVLDKYNPDFFGSTVSEKGEFVTIEQTFADRREKLYDETKNLANMIANRGGQLPEFDVLVRRAAAIAFDDMPTPNRTVTRTEPQPGERVGRRIDELQQQSNRRRPVATSRMEPTSIGKLPPMSAEEIANDPEISEFVRRANEENGTW